MLLCDAQALLGEIDDARNLLQTASEGEVSAVQNAEVLAEVALRFSEYRLVSRLLDGYPETEGAVRQRAAATVHTGSSEAVIAALSTLRAVALGDSAEALLAGANRLMSCVEKPQLDWDEDVAQKLKAEGSARLAVGARSRQLAKKGRFEDAIEILRPHFPSLWALEGWLYVAALRHNSEELVASADAVLDAGPDLPMTVMCGTALREGGESKHAARVLIGVAHNPGASLPVRSEAYHTLLLIVANDQDDWSRTEGLWTEWRDLNTRDDRVTAWYVRIVAHKP
jgi:hypothetical protein